MTKTNPFEAPNKNADKKRRLLCAEKKSQIYFEAQSGDKPVGGLLRREGLYSTDLARIRLGREGGGGQGGGTATPQRDTLNLGPAGFTIGDGQPGIETVIAPPKSANRTLAPVEDLVIL